jgi:septation ring formation regulator EzrA
MTSDPGIELRVSRLENDTNSIYDLIAEIRATQHEHSRRFDSVDQRLDSVDQRFDSVGQRFDSVGQRFDSIDSTLAEVVRRLPEPS